MDTLTHLLVGAVTAQLGFRQKLGVGVADCRDFGGDNRVLRHIARAADFRAVAASDGAEKGIAGTHDNSSA